MLTYDASLSPAVLTVSSLAFKVGSRNCAPAGLVDSLGNFSDPPIFKSDGKKIFRTDKTAVNVSSHFDAIGSDFVQSCASQSAMVNIQRFDHILSFDDLKQTRLVFAEFLNDVSSEYHCFQPL